MAENSELKEFLNTEFLSNDCYVSKDYIISSGLVSLPIPDVMNAMEAEWLSEAATEHGGELIAVDFEYKKQGACNIEGIDSTRDSILQHNFKMTSRYLIITNNDLNFFYYKDQINRYYLLIGDIGFLHKAYRCSFDTAKEMYFEYWLDNSDFSELEISFMTDIWKKYAIS